MSRVLPNVPDAVEYPLFEFIDEIDGEQSRDDNAFCRNDDEDIDNLSRSSGGSDYGKDHTTTNTQNGAKPVESPNDGDDDNDDDVDDLLENLEDLVKDANLGMTKMLSNLFHQVFAVVDPTTKSINEQLQVSNLAPVPLRLSQTGVIRGLTTIRDHTKRISIYDHEDALKPTKDDEAVSPNKLHDELHYALNHEMVFDQKYSS